MSGRDEGAPCPRCGREMHRRSPASGPAEWACPWPTCGYAEPIDTARALRERGYSELPGFDQAGEGR